MTPLSLVHGQNLVSGTLLLCSHQVCHRDHPLCRGPLLHDPCFCPHIPCTGRLARVPEAGQVASQDLC